MSRVLPQQFRLDEVESSAHSNSARIRLFVLRECPQQRVVVWLVFFVCFTLPLVNLQHPFSWRIHTWRIRRVRRDSGAASAAAQSELERQHSAVRQQETEGGGGARINGRMLRPRQSPRIREENGGVAEPGMLGGGGDISINILVGHVTERCSAQMMTHEQP